MKRFAAAAGGLLPAAALFLFSLPSAARAADACSPIDLRPDLGDVRDQGDQSWCYAFALADFFGHNLGLERLSAVDVAASYNRTPIPAIEKFFEDLYHRVFDPSGLDDEHVTGFAPIAAKAALKRRFCSERDLPSDAWIWRSGDGSRQAIPLHAAIRRLHEQRAHPERFDGGRFLFPRVSDAAYAELLGDAKRRELLPALAEAACGPKLAAPAKPTFAYRLNTDADATFAALDRSLAGGRIALIEYLPSVLEDLDSFPAGFHTSVVVGRRPNARTGGCDYLVRNSHGKDCAKYDPRVDCEAGNLWVPRDRLRHYVMTVFTMERK